MATTPIPVGPVEVEIVACNADSGMGQCTVGDRPALVKGVFPGELVRVRPRFRHRGQIICHLEEVLRTVPGRLQPFCPAFADCGGCKDQHVPRAVSLGDRQRRVEDLLKAAGIEGHQWLPSSTGGTRHYRHKARLGVRFVPGKGGALVGFREQASSKVAVIDHCGILARPLDRLIRPLRHLIGELRNPRCVPQLEVAAGEDRAAIIVRHLEPFDPPDLRLWRDLASQYPVDVYLQSAGPESVTLLAPDGGGELLHYTVDGLDMAFHPLDFTQVNPEMNEQLVGAALAAIGAGPGVRVLDLFCGIGNFSLPLAARGASVVGLDHALPQIQRARDNATRNRVNAEFVSRDLYAEGAIPELARDWDWLLVDPPRSGCGNLTVGIVRSPLRRMVYVSCNPATLVTDLVTLCNGGFAVRSVQLFDMFPWTSHVETMAVLERLP